MRKRLRKKKARAAYIGKLYSNVIAMMPGNIQIEKAVIAKVLNKKTRRNLARSYEAYLEWYRAHLGAPMVPNVSRSTAKRLDITMYFHPTDAMDALLHDAEVHHQHLYDGEIWAEHFVVQSDDGAKQRLSELSPKPD
jgi:hypothetical protein